MGMEVGGMGVRLGVKVLRQERMHLNKEGRNGTAYVLK